MKAFKFNAFLKLTIPYKYKETETKDMQGVVEEMNRNFNIKGTGNENSRYKRTEEAN